MQKALAVIALVASALASSLADAQQVTMVVGFPPGATYDIYMRTFARHLGKHLPAIPTWCPEHGRRRQPARRPISSTTPRPKDGTTIGMFARGLAMQPLLDMTGIQYEARKVQLDRQPRHRT